MPGNFSAGTAADVRETKNIGFGGGESNPKNLRNKIRRQNYFSLFAG
jgi:hypothetical protein